MQKFMERHLNKLQNQNVSDKQIKLILTILDIFTKICLIMQGMAGMYQQKGLMQLMKKSYFIKEGGKTGIARRLSLDEPSLTLTCAPAMKQTERCHPTETRPLTVREYARIQTFPDDWEFCGNMTAQYKQIGNAVPVNLAAAVGRSLIRLFNDIETL